LTGGEPLLRGDLIELATYRRNKGFTVVLGTNGVLLRERQARLMRKHWIQGASLWLNGREDPWSGPAGRAGGLLIRRIPAPLHPGRAAGR
jgi:hypothetical protein